MFVFTWRLGEEKLRSIRREGAWSQLRELEATSSQTSYLHHLSIEASVSSCMASAQNFPREMVRIIQTWSGVIKHSAKCFFSLILDETRDRARSPCHWISIQERCVWHSQGANKQKSISKPDSQGIQVDIHRPFKRLFRSFSNDCTVLVRSNWSSAQTTDHDESMHYSC